MRMKIILAIIALIFVGCASQVQKDRDTANEANQIAIAERDRWEKLFLNATPFELCKDKETRARYENLADCKADMATRQAGMRQQILVREQQDEQMRQGLILQLMQKGYR